MSNPKNSRVLYRWHRRVAMIGVLFLIQMTITGFFLNHSSSLNLNKKEPSSFLANQIYSPSSETELGYPLNSITWDRLLLDIHTGRIFGKFGVFLVDVFSLLLLFVGISGIFLWWKRFSKSSS